MTLAVIVGASVSPHCSRFLRVSWIVRFRSKWLHLSVCSVVHGAVPLMTTSPVLPAHPPAFGQPHFAAMPPKAGRPDDAAWVRSQARRQEEFREDIPAGRVADADTWLQTAHRVGELRQEQQGGSASSSDPSGGRPPTYDKVHREVGLRVHRATGLLATGFEPLRHTTFVCGRPVQVVTY